MNKSQLIEKISESMFVTKTQAEEFVTEFCAVVSAELKAGHDVKLVGFGTFLVRKRKARMGYNPKTKEKIKISASRYAKFMPSSVIKEMLNENRI